MTKTNNEQGVRFVACSDDLELLEIESPADFATIEALPAEA